MNPVAIIGAGITGLTAAFCLRQKGIPVVVYEGSGRVGGVIQSIRQEGYLAEFGPNTILETSPKITKLLSDLGLAPLRPDPRAEARYIVRFGRPIRVPSSPLSFFTSPLFTAKAKLGLFRELFVPPRCDGKEETVAEFVVRRLGKEFLEHAVDALVAGVYAGDPYKLSVSQALPKLAELEVKYGSLIRGQVLGARERKKRGELAKDRAPKFTFDEGLQTLPERLNQELARVVRLNTTVFGVTQNANSWTLDLKEGSNETRAEHSAIVYAGTAFRLAELEMVSEVPLTLKPFSEIRYAPVASVVLGFRREDVAHPCEGFGMLIPKVEGFKILGTIFSSSLFPNRAPSGHILLSSYIGGERYPELAFSRQEKLVDITCEDLRLLLGISGQPTFQHTFLYPKAIPQYNIGYAHYRRLMAEIETKAPGLFLAGHYRDGVSLSDSILSGCHAAERVESHCGSAMRVVSLPNRNAA